MKVVIIGKPNVGKSTLFNKLCRKKLAITHDKPGVTRDFKKFIATIGDFKFELFDTAGLDESKDQMNKKMQEMTSSAIKEADLLIFMIDGRRNLTFDDFDLAKKIRKYGKQVIIIANKCEAGLKTDTSSIAKLGFGNPIEISSEHKLGLENLASEIQAIQKSKNLPKINDEDDLDSTNKSIKISFVGRPNAGKSTIYNKIIGSDRVIVSDEAGTTRDAITDFLDFNDRKFEVIDTAGLRKKNKVIESLETLSNVETINAIRRSHIVILVLDSTSPLEKQDLSILNLIAKEGQGILIVFNKSDKVKNKKEFLDEVEYRLDNQIVDIYKCQYLFLSAKNESNMDKILKSIIDIEDSFNREIKTSELNSWLEKTISEHPLPLSSKTKRRIKIKFIRQTSKRPPTFTLFANISNDIPESYVRYLQKSLINYFCLKSVPIRLKCKKNYNPYVK